MKLNFIGLGGTGLNILKRYGNNGFFKDDFTLIGLDTSDGNLRDLDNEKIIIERVPGTHGSGSDPALNADKYPPFLQRIISQYEIDGLVVLVYSGSGGTGSSMGPTAHEMLVEKGIPTVSIVIGDMSDVNRGSNTVRTLLNLNDKTELLDHPIVFSYFQNGESSQGALNADVCSFIDTLRVALSDENIRIDTMDVHHLFFYNKVVKATPILSELSFIAGDATDKYKKNPVAALSLFDNEDNIRPAFSNLLYSKEGIFKPGFQNSKYASMHAVLDHGDAVEGLKKMLADQRVTNAETNDRFQTDNTAVVAKPAGAKAGYTKYDI